MTQELKVLRDFLREHAASGIEVTALVKDAGTPYPWLRVTPQTVRNLVGLLDRLERDSERVDGYARDM